MIDTFPRLVVHAIADELGSTYCRTIVKHSVFGTMFWPLVTCKTCLKYADEEAKAVTRLVGVYGDTSIFRLSKTKKGQKNEADGLA